MKFNGWKNLGCAKRIAVRIGQGPSIMNGELAGVDVLQQGSFPFRIIGAEYQEFIQSFLTEERFNKREGQRK